MPVLSQLEKDIQNAADPKRAIICRSFFKTGPGQYGEGDIFIGITVPALRNLCRKYHGLSLAETERLLKSPVHENRLAALLILTEQFHRGSGKNRKEIHELYLRNLKSVNNWDLVDASASVLVGHYLEDKVRTVLYRLADGGLWERRVAVVATFHFIKKHDFKDTLKLCERMMTDTEDLMHKAMGWMLREVGKRDTAALEKFLSRHCKVMPRTMLRYAIEKFPEKKRAGYMAPGKKKTV